MSSESLLAAVHAAAQSNVPAAQAAPPQNKEIPMSAPEKTAGSTADVKPMSAAELTSAFPEIVAAIRADAAAGERARIIGIDKLAANRKGIAGLVSEMKADATCTVEKAALRILDHEGKQLAAQAENIKGVEAVAAVIKSAPSSGGDKPSYASTPEGWKAEFEASDELKGEFASADDYAAFKANESKVRILGRKSA